MGVKLLRYKIGHGSTKRHALFRALVIASILTVIPLMEVIYSTDVAPGNGAAGDDPALDAVLGQLLFSRPKQFLDRLVEPFYGRSESEKLPETLTADLVAELMDLKLLHHDAKILCISGRSDAVISKFKQLGFPDTHGFLKHVYELEFHENSIDFIFCEDLDSVASPALLVLEMESVMKHGGIGAVLVSTTNGGSFLNSLVRSASAISSWLKQSRILRVSYLDEFIVVIFKKTANDFDSSFQLQSDCRSVMNNKPYLGFIEPLTDQKPHDFPKSVTYLPKFIDISLKNRPIYIDIGAAEHLNDNFSSFLSSYPIESKAFNVYYVDHNISTMAAYIEKPGVTFVYHPDLAAEKNINAHEDLESFPEDNGFDFLNWFKEIVKTADFVVMKMNTSEAEMKLLCDLIKSGEICFIDELFLHCSNGSNCIGTLQALRSRGLMVHQWWGR